MENKGVYFVIAAFRSLDDLKKQMKTDSINDDQLKNIRFEDNSSVFETAIANRNYEIADYLLEIKTPLNVLVHPEMVNEFHIIAPTLWNAHAVSIANELLDRGVDLKQRETKYGNTAMFSLALDINRPRNRNDSTLAFLNRCMEKGEGLHEKNKRGLCAMDILIRAGIMK
ncbi:MAG: hypothetical protein IJR97_04095 [Clostridia bacterium]|nr:hypothetical protein [Clostridia bacterium]